MCSSDLKAELPESLLAVPDIPLKSFPTKIIIDTSVFSDGIYDYYGADVITIGKLICELRIQQKVSQQVLCQGLCSKSKLSKIENGSLNPDVILAETLLQRLGLSEREFVFWGNAKEAKFHELKFKLIRSAYLNESMEMAYINELKQLISEKDILYKQFMLYEEANLIDNNPQKRLSLLTESLNCTLNNFDIYKITEYRLSWIELTILNNIAFEYRYTDIPYQGILYFRQILNYHRAIQTDCILQSQTYVVTLHLFFRILYVQNYFNEIIDLFNQIDFSILSYQIARYSMIYFYYAQSLGECSQYDAIPLPTRYCYSIGNIIECSDNGKTLVESLSTDFSLDIIF